MPFVRDPVPQSNDVSSLRSFLERTLATLDQWAQQIETRVNELVRLRQVSGVEVRYDWSDDTTIATPALPGEIKCDAVLPENATQFAVSRTDQFGRLALTASLEFISEGFFELNDISRTHHYEYSFDNVVQRADDVTFDVVFLQAGTGAPPSAGDLVQAQWWPGELLPTRKNI